MDKPNWWDPLVLRGGVPVNPKPDKGAAGQPNNPGARAVAYQDFGPEYADNFTVGVQWNGEHGAVGFPIACINHDDPDWGLAFCYEMQIWGGAYVLWAMGRRPDQIRVVRSAGRWKERTWRQARGRHAHVPRNGVQGNTVTCLANGNEILKSPIPKALVGSTTHGFGLDVNLVPGRPANFEVIDGPFVIAPQKP